MNGNIQVYGVRNKKSRRQIDSRGISIDDLPENVITHILSLLPMKDALRTSVLSKEWEYRWASICHINIDGGHQFPCRPSSEDDFHNLVDRILLHSLNIQSFRLVSGRQVCDTCRLKTWISYLSRREVQSIEISSDTHLNFFLPSCVFGITSLTRLKLKMSCIIKFPPGDYFSNLKLLFLSSVHFRAEHFSNTDRLIMMFPVLESLELRFCTWANVKFVEISSPVLTTFGYYSTKVEKDFLIKICGAMLETFQIGRILLDNFDLSASSVVYAAIDHFTGICEHPFIGVGESHSRISIKEFSGLRYLRLSGEITKAYAQLKPGLPLPRFYRLQKLEISICGSIEGFLELLHMAPALKQLIIVESLQEDDDSEYFNFDEIESMPSCMLSHLSEIKFSEFWGTTHELHLVKFLLRNSAKLEKFVFSNPRISEADIKMQLSTNFESSTCISVVFTYERKYARHFRVF